MRSALSYIRNPRKTATIAREIFKEWLIKQPVFAQFWRKITPVPAPEKWVFVVGCYNSGTTILLKMLAQHPRVSILDEGVFRTNKLITPEELGWTRMWHKVVDQVRLLSTDSAIDAVAVQKDWAFFLDTQKPILVEKSIVNSARIPWLNANFPNAHFIFIVRNGYAVAEGIQRKVVNRRYPIPAKYGETYPIELCAEQWIQSNQLAEQDLLLVPDVHRITYEELCDAPSDALAAIWEFLELEDHNEVGNLNREWEIHGRKDFVKNMNQRSLDRLSEEDRLRIESVALELLQYYKYSS